MTITQYENQLKTNYNSDLFLGRLVWYTITEEVAQDHTDFCANLLSRFNGIDPKPDVPPAPRTTDVFKRACTAAEARKVPSDEENVTSSNYMLRPTGHDVDHVWRTIVREDVDANGHELGYSELVRITFDRKDANVRFKLLPDGWKDTRRGITTSIMSDIKQYCDEEANKLTAYAIRELTRKTLERKLFAVKARPSGGIYFVQEKFADSLEALATTINSLGDGTVLHTLPLLDDGKQREMLRNAFEEETAGEAEKLIGEIADIIKSGKEITVDRYAQFKVEYDRLVLKQADYSALLENGLDNTSARLEVMEGQIFNLMGNIKSTEQEDDNEW